MPGLVIVGRLASPHVHLVVNVDIGVTLGVDGAVPFVEPLQRLPLVECVTVE